jgi:hypothetical protein
MARPGVTRNIRARHEKGVTIVKQNSERKHRRKSGVSVLTFGILVVVCIGIISIPGSAADQDEELRNLAAELAKKRSQVETLSTELDLKKSRMRDQLKSLATQKAELEIQIKKEEMKLSQIEQDLSKHEDRVSRKKVSETTLKPVVIERIQELKNYVQGALPFKLSERAAELEKLEELVTTNKLEPEKALARLWTLLEAELRLTHENGLYRQSIVIGGENQLADVVKLGMVLMYFRTFEGQVGYVVRAGNGWEYKVINGREDRKRILYLFDSLEKHIRQGYFELPNPL